MTTPAFSELLSRIDDRSAALRAAASKAAADARVPGCPEWSARDLVAHVGEVQRFWAAVVAAGPAERPPDIEVPIPDGELSTWFAESTAQLRAALAAAGPDQGCWTWWQASSAPATAGAVARHQVQEAAVHARDAQEAADRAEPVPATIALDAVAEFVVVAFGSCGGWPGTAAQVALRADEGQTWVLSLSERGAVVTDDGTGAGATPDATLRGSASDLLLALYGRRPLDALRVDGDRAVIERLLAWPPLD